MGQSRPWRESGARVADKPDDRVGDRVGDRVADNAENIRQDDANRSHVSARAPLCGCSYGRRSALKAGVGETRAENMSMPSRTPSSIGPQLLRRV
jgi:hypothetical protein